MKKKKLLITDFRVKRAIVLYKSGMSIPKFCKLLRMDPETIANLFKVHGIFRPLSESIRKGKSGGVFLNDDALDVLTPDALYWIGFLYADGSVSKDRPRMSLTLSEIDKAHLSKYSKFFNTVDATYIKPQKTQDGYMGNPSYRVTFSSSKIWSVLKSLGFTSRKTYDITPHELLINSRDFWRGVIDGDGWVICQEKVNGVGICGHENTVKSFLEFIRKCGVDTKTTALRSKKSKHLWYCEIHSHKAVSSLRILYEGAATYLDRKYDKYQEILKKPTTKNNDNSNKNKQESHPQDTALCA